jgi:hypothetical protein
MFGKRAEKGNARLCEKRETRRQSKCASKEQTKTGEIVIQGKAISKMSIYERMQAMADEIIRLQGFEAKYLAEIEKTKAEVEKTRKVEAQLKAYQKKEREWQAVLQPDSEGTYNELAVLSTEVEKFIKEEESYERNLQRLQKENEALKGVIFDFYMKREEAMQAIGHKPPSEISQFSAKDITGATSYDMVVLQEMCTVQDSIEKSLQEEINHLRGVVIRQNSQLQEKDRILQEESDRVIESIDFDVDSDEMDGRVSKRSLLPPSQRRSPRRSSPRKMRLKVLQALSKEYGLSETKNSDAAVDFGDSKYSDDGYGAKIAKSSSERKEFEPAGTDEGAGKGPIKFRNEWKNGEETDETVLEMTNRRTGELDREAAMLKREVDRILRELSNMSES